MIYVYKFNDDKYPPTLQGVLKAYNTTRVGYVPWKNVPFTDKNIIKTIETFLTHATYADISEILCPPVPFSVSYAKTGKYFPKVFLQKCD